MARFPDSALRGTRVNYYQNTTSNIIQFQQSRS